MSDADLTQLAIDRSGTAQRAAHARRHVLTRYVLPAVLILGFLAVLAWAARDLIFPPRPVKVVPVLATQSAVQRAGTPLFKAAGWIEPRPTPVRVAALAPGVVQHLLVVEDQPVTAGQPVAELVKEDARLALERAQADLKLREAERDEAVAARTAAATRLAEPVHLEAELGDAEAALAGIETELQNLPFALRRAAAEQELAEKDYQGKVAAEGVVARVEVDRAKSALDSARALTAELRDRAGSLERQRTGLIQRRDAMRKQLELLADEKKALDGAAARLKAATARIEQARVAVAEAELQLDRMTVRAPIEGRVYRLVGHPGTRLAAAMGHTGTHDGSTVVTLYQPDLLQVRVDVRFEDIPQVRLGQPVQIVNPALGEPLDGKVLFVSSEADIQKNTLQVKVEIPAPPTVLKPEMLVDATFLAPPGDEQTAAPAQQMRLYLLRQLVKSDEGGSFVWLADQSAGVARKQPVQTGRDAAGGLIEITAGLSVSSRIISSGGDGLRDGDRIRVTGEDPMIGTNSGDKSGSSGREP